MKITLKNFRCYEYSTFDFGEKGIALLCGPSGAGKSSILIGIYFGLFGTGNKLIMYGKTTCSVTIEFDGMTITRSKRPNRLIVNNVYEDGVGQSIIDKKFGESFKTTGYISQNARDSFILMSPIEKLSFLESFVFQDINMTHVKKRCKDLIKERHENLIKTTSNLEMATLMIDELNEPENVEFPIKCLKKNREQVVKNEHIKSNNNMIKINKCKRNINTLQKELNAIKVLDAQITTKQESVDSLIEKLSDMSLEESSVEYEGDEIIREYKNKLSRLISNREVILLQKRYDEDVIRLEYMKEEEKNKKESSIKTIENSIWQEYDKKECENTITDYKLIIKDLEKLSDLKNDIERYNVDENQLNQFVQNLKKEKQELTKNEKLLDKLEIQQEIFQCPSCDISLRFRDDDLHIDEDTTFVKVVAGQDIDSVSRIIHDIKKHINVLESTIPIKQTKLTRHGEISKSIQNIEDKYEDIPILSEIKTDLVYINNYKIYNEDMDRKLTNLKSTNIYSATIISFGKSLEQQENKIKSIITDIKIDEEIIEEEELRLIIITQENNKEKIKSAVQISKKINYEKDIYERDIKSFTLKHIENYKKIRKIHVVEEDIKNNNIYLLEIEKKYTENQTNMKNIEIYQKYIKEKDIYDSWNIKIDILKKEEIEHRKLYAASTLLKENIIEAESIAMLNVLSSINTHTQGYLEEFFPDNPISVKLVPFKESKNGKTVKIKPQINLEIEYKGMEADINMLSGGELSRVILAYALALGEMFNTPMMLLDECTASLDQDLTGIVMDAIKELFTGKLIIAVCHQVVVGQFDKVVTAII